MRAVDDKIIYKLNTSVPTVSFSEEISAREKCKDLYEQVRLLAYMHTHSLNYSMSQSDDWIAGQ